MPELPEVETTRRGIAPHFIGATIKDVIVRESRLRWPVPPDLKILLQDLTVRSIDRRAKYLIVNFDTGHLIIHLGMSGSLRYLTADTPPQKHEHVDIVLGDHLLRYRDPRRFGAILWHSGPIEFHPLLQHLGPEPLSADFDADYLYSQTRKRSQAIKLAIMDNHLVVGVGNIYANESLFHAGISPTRSASGLSREECQTLVDKIRIVLTKAIEAGGSTLKDFVNSDGKAGYFQQTYYVYDRQEQPCRQCGSAIRQLRQGQRSTYYCPLCQSC